MSKTVTFIKRNWEEESEGRPGYFTNWTLKQLVELRRKLGGQGFFAVPESHAEQVMRGNDSYQEVDIERVTELAAKPRRASRGA